MQGKTHFSFGILAGLLYYNYTGDNLLPIMTGAVIGSLIPDIDNMSTISEFLPILHKPWRCIQRITNMLLRKVKRYRKRHKKLFGILMTIDDLFDHRGITHSLVVPSLMSVANHNNMIATGVVVGWISHLVADMLNDRGIPLFMPIIDYRFRIAGITTGKVGESVVYNMFAKRL
jgi:membrane-bound metal-dependent hydrolase YbcI (DUF457 family)